MRIFEAIALPSDDQAQQYSAANRLVKGYQELGVVQGLGSVSTHNMLMKPHGELGGTPLIIAVEDIRKKY